jgi:alcohol dehydrogenase class IV
VAEADFPTLIDQAARASSMQGNPIRLEADELTEILRRAW